MRTGASRASARVRTQLADLAGDQVTVGVNGDYATIDDAMDAFGRTWTTVWSPGTAQYVLILLPGTHTIAKDAPTFGEESKNKYMLPVGSSIIALDPTPANTTVFCNWHAPWGQPGYAAFQFQGDNLIEGFTFWCEHDATGHLLSYATPVEIVNGGGGAVRRIVAPFCGWDAVFVDPATTGEIDITVDSCEFGIYYDGIAINSSAVTGTLACTNSTIYKSRTHITGGQTVPQPVCCVRIQANDFTATITGNSLSATQENETDALEAHCISSGNEAIVDGTSTSSDISVIGCNLTVTCGATATEPTGAIVKNTGTLAIKDTNIVMIGDKVAQDYALHITDVSNYSGEGISNTSITTDVTTLAQAQVDAGDNSGLTGFKVT